MRMGNPAGKVHLLSVTDWIILPLAALLFHVLLFTLFVPTEPENETRAARSRFTLMLQEDPLQQKGSSDPYKLRYSLRYMNPEDLVKADSVNGFSRILDRKRVKLPSPFHCPHSLYEQKSFYQAHPEQRLPEERFLDDFPFSFPGEHNHRKSPVLPEKRKVLNYPVWIDHSHKIFTGFFLNDAAERRIFERCRERAHSATILCLDTEKGRIPSVMIRRSCGVPELDLLALRQLSARKENYDPVVSGEGRKRSFYRVIWNPRTAIPAERTLKK